MIKTGRLTIILAALMLLSSRGYAQDIGSLQSQVDAWHADRARVEALLGIDPNKDIYPRPTCYYDDLVDHYEQDQLMRDMIDKGIR